MLYDVSFGLRELPKFETIWLINFKLLNCLSSKNCNDKLDAETNHKTI